MDTASFMITEDCMDSKLTTVFTEVLSRTEYLIHLWSGKVTGK